MHITVKIVPVSIILIIALMFVTINVNASSVQDNAAPKLLESPSPSGLIDTNNPNLNIKFVDNIGFNSNDKLANIKSYKIDGNTYTIKNPSCITISADTKTLNYHCSIGTLSNGEHTLEFHVQDLAGNVDTSPIWTYTQNTAPTVAMPSTSNDAPEPVQTVPSQETTDSNDALTGAVIGAGNTQSTTIMWVFIVAAFISYGIYKYNSR